MSSVQRLAHQMMAEKGFLGVPEHSFELAGRQQIVALLNEGMLPESRVVEIGCGCLRIAYWLVRFLDSGCYFGIEPARQRVELGKKYLMTPEILDAKCPQFDFNADMNTSIFGQKFDFFLARSIWTHASKFQIGQSLDSYCRDATDSAVFLVSYLPARTPEEDYLGNQWVGTSHESDVPGVIRHSLAWIEEQCAVRGLEITEMAGLDCDSQFWLKICRS